MTVLTQYYENLAQDLLSCTQLSECSFPFAETDTGFSCLLGIFNAFYFYILCILYNTDESITGPLLMTWCLLKQLSPCTSQGTN